MACYKIISRLNGLTLDVAGGNTQPGAPVLMGNSLGINSLLWYDDPMTGTIRSTLNGFCLDIEGDQTLRVMPFQQGDPNQQWERDPQGYIRNRIYRNKVLDICRRDTSVGAFIIMWDQNGGENQLWNFEIVSGSGPSQSSYPGSGQYPGQSGYPPTQYPGQTGYPTAQYGQQSAQQGYPAYPNTGASTQRREFHILSELSGKVIDIKGGKGQPGDDLVTWSKHNGKNQVWYSDPQGFIRSALNDSAIDAAQGKKAEVQPFNGGPTQQWVFEGKKIVNRSNGEVLDVYGEKKGDGATVGSYRWKDTPNQHWRLEYV